MVERATAALALGLALSFAGGQARASGSTAPACQSARVKDIRPGAPGAFPSANAEAPVALGGSLFFAADDGQHGTEPWKSDGTAAGTVLLKDVLAGAESSNPRSMIAAGARLFFVADDGAHGAELWTSDG